MATPNDLKPAIDAANHSEAHMIASMLKEQGIEAFVFDTAASNLLWDAPGLINQYMVHVQQKDVDRARAFIRTNRDESIDLDWDEVDVGEMSDDGCLSYRDTEPFSLQRLISSLLPWIMILLVIVLAITAIA